LSPTPRPCSTLPSSARPFPNDASLRPVGAELRWGTALPGVTRRCTPGYQRPCLRHRGMRPRPEAPQGPTSTARGGAGRNPGSPPSHNTSAPTGRTERSRRGDPFAKRRLRLPRWDRIAVGHGVTRGYASLHPGLSTSMPSAWRNETPARGPTGADVDSPGWSGAQPRVPASHNTSAPTGAHGAFATG